MSQRKVPEASWVHRTRSEWMLVDGSETDLFDPGDHEVLLSEVKFRKTWSACGDAQSMRSVVLTLESSLAEIALKFAVHWCQHEQIGLGTSNRPSPETRARDASVEASIPPEHQKLSGMDFLEFEASQTRFFRIRQTRKKSKRTNADPREGNFEAERRL